MRTLSAFEHFSRVAGSEESPKTKPLVAESSSPVQQISRVFDFQSYFDDTLRERALLVQRTNELIVSSTQKEEQVPGYAVGLHPSSQTPVAIQFKIGAQPTSSQPIILKPGQVVRPHGLPHGMKSGAFSGFTWGLPFGWLGGGMATLLVFQTPDADVYWPGNPEVVFHRTRMAIVAAGALPANAPLNWPTRFPWGQALQGTNAIVQAGQPTVAVEPTRTVMRLRLSTLAAAADMRIIFQATNEFDLDSAGATIATPVGFVDFTWGAFASVGAGDLGTQYPIRELGGEFARLAADDGGVQLVDLTGTLVGNFVDIVRYGRL